MDGLGGAGAFAQRAPAMRGPRCIQCGLRHRGSGGRRDVLRAGSLPTASAVVGDIVQAVKRSEPVGELVAERAAFDAAPCVGSFCARVGDGFVRLDGATRAEAAAHFGQDAGAILRVLE